ncbi:MAG: LysM peptidoglycan-binding domain-containing protein, partial [Bacteroidota bacterium]
IPEALSRTHELPALKGYDLQQFFQMHLPGQQVEAGWIEEWENATAACRNLRLQIWLQQLKAGSAPDSSLPSLQEYYLQTLANFPSDADRVQALALLEDHLLSPDYQTRAIIKEQTLLQEYPQSVWEPLIKAGIVRPLPSYHFGKAYELSHDCWRKEVAHYHEQRLIALQRQRWLKKAGVITTAAMIFLASLSWLAGKTNWPYGPEAPIRDTIYIQTNNANARYSRDTLNLYDTTKETILIRDTIQIRDTIAIYPSGPCPPPVCVGCDSLNLVIHQLRLRINELQAQLPCPPSAPMLPRSLNPISITFDVSDPFGGGSNKLTFNAYAHIVKTGENLNQIARLLIRPESDSPDDLRQMKQKIVEMNKLASENAIKAGQVILLPMY